MTKPNVVVCDNNAALNQEAARRFSALAAEAIAARGRFLVSLSGGSTPKALYQLLATPEWRNGINWSKSHLFWGDERFVPADDPQSNYRMTSEALLSKIPIPSGNVHAVPTQLGKAEEAAAAYEKTIRQVAGTTGNEIPRFDLILLGLGENGHTASLFPHSPLLHETNRLVAADFVQEVNLYRITMTVPLINHARRGMFLVSGSGKAAVLKEVLTGPQQPEELPAQLIKLDQGMLIWLVDKPAASLLPAAVA